MKPNFEAMNKAQLRAYVLEHREDLEALRALMSRRDPNGVKSFNLCYWATKMYRSINLVRLDERTGNVFILIGEDIEIEIQPNGQWTD